MSDNKKGVDSLTSGLAGAIIGAAATAAAIVLSDEKNRKKAEKILGDLQKNGDKVLKEISKKALELKESAIAHSGGKALPKPVSKKVVKKASGKKK
ncbi:hypothetical protein A3J13_02235 [Candidatus Daviesbacteria bacterium RIFCSPLOWO2_02_FULL_36_8]|uniref:YtxH domain-containing protein n=1 Tax=Candidatus Daviesbacteria bacterium RIFCSPLOWO2_02_FULL_36_8 TaxID=1797793 RepID=A0A1F5MH16_9BACT|nr:MAG: hypothetical protein A3J13_02235 [Candidatus Daviesbacteria bacterium RIFCSPLOWO2_02_FULL_36_8]